MRTQPKTSKTRDLAPADSPIDSGADPHSYAPLYQPVTLLHRHDGWTADRQRAFLSALAETGSVSRACLHTGLTARSAYRLRAHPGGAAFAQGWDQALRLATRRLTSLAFERATQGTVREQWRDGKLVSETREPSDKLLIFLLQSHAPYTADPVTRWAKLDDMATAAGAGFAKTLDGLADSAVPADQLAAIDFQPTPPKRDDGPPAEPFDQDDAW